MFYPSPEIIRRSPLLSWGAVLWPLMLAMRRRFVDALPLPELPVLDPSNKDQHPEWHAYYERVYHGPVVEPIDLNMFSWFYWDAPFTEAQKANVAKLKSVAYGVKKNVPYIYVHPDENRRNSKRPVPAEIQAAKAGFFVHRDLTDAQLAGPVIEVMRTTDSIVYEHGVIWFYVAIGSGFWLDCGDAPVLQEELYSRPNVHWNECDPYPCMAAHQVQALLRHRGSAYNVTGLPELIYRLDAHHTPANSADVPMTRGRHTHRAKYVPAYDPVHHCLC